MTNFKDMTPEQAIQLSQDLAKQAKEVAEFAKQLKSSQARITKLKEKKPITYAIHEAASTGNFSLRIERGQLKQYLNPDFIEFIVNNKEELLKVCQEINQKNSDKELSKKSA